MNVKLVLNELYIIDRGILNLRSALLLEWAQKALINM
jgi:hypothetical protein